MVRAAATLLERCFFVPRVAAAKHFDAHAALTGLTFAQGCLLVQIHARADVLDDRFRRKRPQGAGWRIAPVVAHLAQFGWHDVARGMHKRVQTVDVVIIVWLLASGIAVRKMHVLGFRVQGSGFGQAARAAS